MKELIINGIEYAKYEMDGDKIYLKMINRIGEGSPIDSENALIQIIQLVEKRRFKLVGYLNV